MLDCEFVLNSHLKALKYFIILKYKEKYAALLWAMKMYFMDLYLLIQEICNL